MSVFRSLLMASKKLIPDEYQRVEYIQSNGESTDTDIGDAIEFDNKELALTMCEFLNRRNASRNNYKVMCIKTTIEEVVEETIENERKE